MPNILSSYQNYLINGGFEFWQRYGTTNIHLGDSQVSDRRPVADRWWMIADGTRTNFYVNQYETELNSKSPSQYALRLARTASNTSTQLSISTWLETRDVVPLIGKNVTFSVWLRRGSAYNGTIQLILNVLDREEYLSDAVTLASQTITINNNQLDTTIFQPFTVTLYIAPSYNGIIPKGLRCQIQINTPSGYDPNYYVDVSSAQLNEGTTRLQWKRRGASFAEELQLCQRYYETSYRLNQISGWSGSVGCQAIADGDRRVKLFGGTAFKVTKRIDPTAICVYGGLNGDTNGKISLFNNVVDPQYQKNVQLDAALSRYVSDIGRGGATHLGHYIGLVEGEILSTSMLYMFQWTVEAELSWAAWPYSYYS